MKHCPRCGEGKGSPCIKVRARFSKSGRFLTLQCEGCGDDLGTWIIFKAE